MNQKNSRALALVLFSLLAVAVAAYATHDGVPAQGAIAQPTLQPTFAPGQTFYLNGVLKSDPAKNATGFPKLRVTVTASNIPGVLPKREVDLIVSNHEAWSFNIGTSIESKCRTPERRPLNVQSEFSLVLSNCWVMSYRLNNALTPIPTQSWNLPAASIATLPRPTTMPLGSKPESNPTN